VKSPSARRATISGGRTIIVRFGVLSAITPFAVEAGGGSAAASSRAARATASANRSGSTGLSK
jgi:hypothetical protein